MIISRRMLLAGTASALWLHTAVGAAIAQGGANRVIDVRIEGRRVVAPAHVIRVDQGDKVELRWISDEAVELHLHGYDVELHLQPHTPATMTVTATASGRFPITSHGWGDGAHNHDALTYFEVYPR